MSEPKKPTVQTSVQAEPSPLDVAIDGWFVDHFGITNPAWLSPAAKADLKKRLAALGGNP